MPVQLHAVFLAKKKNSMRFVTYLEFVTNDIIKDTNARDVGTKGAVRMHQVTPHLVMDIKDSFNPQISSRITQ